MCARACIKWRQKRGNVEMRREIIAYMLIYKVYLVDRILNGYIEAEKKITLVRLTKERLFQI